MLRGSDLKGLSLQVLENLTTAILVLDDELRLIYLNPSAENLLEVSLARIYETPIDEVFHESPESIDTMAQSLRNGHPYTKREAQITIVGSGTRNVDYTVTPLQDGLTGDIILIELQQLDRLMRISREEALVSSHQATRALIRGVAHEVKNPLGGIRGAAQLLDKELNDPDLHDYTQVIIDEADRLRNLVDQMLGPRKPSVKDAISIHEVLERVKSVIEIESKHEVTVKRDYDPSLPDLQGDTDQLIQAVLNIARNAYQALLEDEHNEQPVITLRTRALRQFTIGAIRHRLAIRVDVLDNGPGIAPELMESLFFPMVSSRANGTGLGLPIAQSIVQQHHGIIECDSKPGETAFSIILPVEPPA